MSPASSRKNGHTSIKGDSDICGLDADEIVEGTGTTDIALPIPPPVITCTGLAGGATLTATYGLASGVQCTSLDASGIGVQSVIDAGFIAAVDVWGYVEQGVEICYPQIGSLTFLDAATSPRTVSTMSSYARGNSTCALLTRAGTVVLVPGTPTGTAPVTSVTVAGQPVAGTGAEPVAGGCPIHTIGHLFLRASPSLQGEIVGHVPRGSNLNSPSRTTFWYQVTYLGQSGWIGHKYVRANC